MTTKLLSRVSLVVLGCGLALVLVELLLQVASYSVWSQSQRRLETAITPLVGRNTSEERVVLCIGDSNTYGAGASSADRSYPAQLETLLNAGEDSGLHWTVINHGWPGRNSAELLHRLPALLVEIEPDYVAILVGANNDWNQAMMDREPPEQGAELAMTVQEWTWRWRTRRLFDLVEAAWRARPEVLGAEALVPEASVARSPGPMGGSVRGADRDAIAPAAPTVTVDRSIRDPALRASLREADQLWSDDRAQPSIELSDRLFERVEGSRDVIAWELLAHLLLRQARPERVIELGSVAVDRFGRTPDLCLTLGRAYRRLGQIELAKRWLSEAIVLEPDSARHHRAMAMALAHRAQHLEDAVVSTTRAFALDADERLLKVLLRDQIVVGLRRETFEAALVRSGVTAEQARVLRAAFSESASRLSRADDRLRRDLSQLALMAAQAGSRPILLTYAHPAVQDRAGNAVHVVARQLGLQLLDVTPEFAERLERDGRNHYFNPDLHPNDRGYGVFAARVRDRLVEIEGE